MLFNIIPKIILVGEEILAGDDIYGGADRLLSQVVPRSGVLVKLVWFMLVMHIYFLYNDKYRNKPAKFLDSVQCKSIIDGIVIFCICRRVNTSDLNEVASALGPRTKLVWLESPTNPRIQISDIRVRISVVNYFDFVSLLMFSLWQWYCSMSFF